jgi:YNFM family putative membrane transporter
VSTAAAPPTHALGHRPGTPAYRRVVVALFAAGVATFALLYSTQALLPELADAFHVSAAHTTLSLSLTTAGLAGTLLVVGPLSDVVGRTRLIHLSLASSAVVALACALAPTWEVLLALRFAQGVALAGLPAVATAYLREELHPSSHARAVGLYVGGTAIGGMAGRLVTGPVAEVAGWRWALAAVAVVGVSCAVTVRLLLPPSQHFVPRSAGHRALLGMARRAVSDPALLALYGMGACSAGAFVGVFNALGFRLAGAPFDLGVGAASLVFSVYVVGTAASTIAGRLADRWGRRAVAPFGCVVALAGLALTLPAWLPTVVAGVALLTAGFFVVHGVASGWVPARAHAGGVTSGQAASLYLFAYYVGSSVFGGLAGRAWTDAAWPGVVVLGGVLVAVTAALSLFLRATPTLLGPAADRPATRPRAGLGTSSAAAAEPVAG